MRDEFINEQDSVLAHLPWAVSEPYEFPPVTGMPKQFIPGRPDSDVPLPCAGRWLAHDGEVVTKQIAEYCGTCPARAWCHEWAMANDAFGVWAGLNTDDRAALRRQKERAAA